MPSCSWCSSTTDAIGSYEEPRNGKTTQNLSCRRKGGERNYFLPYKPPRNTSVSPKQMSTFSPLRLFFSFVTGPDASGGIAEGKIKDF